MGLCLEVNRHEMAVINIPIVIAEVKDVGNIIGLQKGSSSSMDS